MTIVQLGVKEAQRGRGMGTWYRFTQIAGGIGAYGIGAYGIGEASIAFGLKLPTVLFAGLCLAVWAVIYLNRRKLIG